LLVPFDSRNVHDVTKLDGTRTQRVFYKKESYKNAARRRLPKQEAEAASRSRAEHTELPGLTPGSRSAATVPAQTRRRAGVGLRPDGPRRSRGADWMRLVRIASKCLTTWDRIRDSNLATTICQAPAGEGHRGSGEGQARPGDCALQQTVARLQQEKDAAVQAKGGLEQEMAALQQEIARLQQEKDTVLQKRNEKADALQEDIMSMAATVTRQQKMLSALKRRHMEIVGDTAKDRSLKAPRGASSFLQQLPLHM